MTRTLKESHGFTVVSLLLPCLLLGPQTGCTTRLRAASDLDRLQGTWEGVVVGDESGDRVTITISGDSFRFHRDAEFWFDTTIALPAGTDPRQLRATITRCPPSQASALGKVVPVIFKIEDGMLTLAVFQDNEAEPPGTFEDKEAVRYELLKSQPEEDGAGNT